MSAEFLFLALLVGFCGSDGSRISPMWPIPPKPLPGPWHRTLIALVGGALGGFVALRSWPTVGAATGTDALITALGAWLGAILLADLVRVFYPARSNM